MESTNSSIIITFILAITLGKPEFYWCAGAVTHHSTLIGIFQQ